MSTIERLKTIPGVCRSPEEAKGLQSLGNDSVKITISAEDPRIIRIEEQKPDAIGPDFFRAMHDTLNSSEKFLQEARTSAKPQPASTVPLQERVASASNHQEPSFFDVLQRVISFFKHPSSGSHRQSA